MELVFTTQALHGFVETLDFARRYFNEEQVLKIEQEILGACETLLIQPYTGQLEPLLVHFGLNHRRILVKHTKVIYRVENQTIYIIDIFDSRQDPSKMNG